MNNQSDNGAYTKGILVGAIIGGAVGAIAALLFAPKSGAELRKDIADKSADLYGKTSDYLTSMQENVGTAVNNTVNEGRMRAEAIISSAKKQAEDLLGSAEQILHDARTKAVSAKDQVQDKIDQLRDATKASVSAFKNEMSSNQE